ncbi:MAG: DUF1599 domain-containing protein [Bacteroidota bacterium]
MYTATETAFLTVAQECREVFQRKAEDYGGSWRLFRHSSLTDQVFIKARRIRQLEEMGDRPAVPEGVADEYRGIFNYAVMALMRLWYPDDLPDVDLAGTDPFSPLSADGQTAVYDRVVERLLELMRRKNHDYGEAWRAMRLSSMTDQILVRVWRLKQLEDNGGRAKVSEGADANYADIANYCIFALIRLASPRERPGG